MSYKHDVECSQHWNPNLGHVKKGYIEMEKNKNVMNALG